MSDDRQERIRELAWRTRARIAQPQFIEGLPEPVRNAIRFLDLVPTEEHEQRLGQILRKTEEEVVTNLDDKWEELAALWAVDDEIVLMPAVNQHIGALVMPFRHLAAHRKSFLDQNYGSLYVSDPDLHRGFSYMAGETQNVLRRWPKSL